MIALELKWALLLYSSVLALMAIAGWIYTEVTVRRPHRFLGKQYLWRCTYCGYTYLDESGDELSQCPRCESFNSASEEQTRFVPVKTPTGKQAERTEERKDEPRRNPSHRKRPHQRRRGPRRG
ncbi:MAG: hypothetical protein IT364_15705 [Candidatus Hydrogenedentes bacterium]|nr:hypothetical protein [Candidatus Hydrogenedentota bacterium]